VLRVVCHQTKVSKEDVLSKDRSARIVWPRQMAMYVLHKRLNWPMPLIGTSFEKHHTSVIHSCKIVEGRMETEPDKKEEVNEIMRLLTAELKSPEVLITY
jgi:chromosomal replication initiator protein